LIVTPKESVAASICPVTHHGQGVETLHTQAHQAPSVGAFCYLVVIFGGWQ
jgi:hypothetical protein